MGWLGIAVRIYVWFVVDSGADLLVVGSEGLVVHVKEENTASVKFGGDGEIL